MTDKTPQHLRVVSSNDTPAISQTEFEPEPRLQLNDVQYITAVSVIVQNIEILQQAGKISVADMNQIFHKIGVQHIGGSDPQPPLAS